MAQHKVGPFTETPFKQFRCCLVNIVPNKNSAKFALVHKLSHPFDRESVFSLISPEEAQMSHREFVEFVDRVRHAAKGAKLGKFDLANAYKSGLAWPNPAPQRFA